MSLKTYNFGRPGGGQGPLLVLPCECPWSSIRQSTTRTEKIKSRYRWRKRVYENYNYVYFNKFDKLYKLEFLLQQKRGEQKNSQMLFIYFCDRKNRDCNIKLFEVVFYKIIDYVGSYSNVWRTSVFGNWEKTCSDCIKCFSEKTINFEVELWIHDLGNTIYK